jgi:hypothetical protein
MSPHVRLVVVAGFLLAGCGDTVPAQPTSLPAGSAAQDLLPFSVSGYVSDTAYRALAGARVEVVSGPGTGTFAIVREDSRFGLPGTFTDTISLRVSKDGHVSQTRTVSARERPTTHPADSSDFSLAFFLEPSGPSADITGVYSMTLTPARTCDLPPEHRHARSYTATIVQSGQPNRFQATLSDTRFIHPLTLNTLTFHEFFVGVAGDIAGFGAGYIERTGDSGYLVVTTAAEGTISASGITGQLVGDLYYCPGEPYQDGRETYTCEPGPGSGCQSQIHQLTLIRR